MKVFRVVIRYFAVFMIGIALRGAIDAPLFSKYQASFNSLHESYDRLSVAFTKMAKANHTNEQNVRDCLAGWNGLIDGVNKDTAMRTAILKAGR